MEIFMLIAPGGMEWIILFFTVILLNIAVGTLSSILICFFKLRKKRISY